MTISNAEWEIMRVVWAQQNTTSNEILAVLLEKYYLFFNCQNLIKKALR